MEFILNMLDLATIYYFGFLTITYTAYILAGRKILYRKVLLIQIPAAFVMGTLCETVIYTYYIHLSFLRFELFSTVYGAIEITLQVLWIYLLLRDIDKKRSFFYASTIFPVGVISSSILITLVSAINVKYSRTLQTIIRLAAALLVIGIILIAIRLVSKTKFWGKLQAFGNYPKLYIPMSAVYFSFYIIISTFGSNILPSQSKIIVVNFFYLMLFGVIVLIVSYIKRTESLNTAQNLLFQQQNYINKLESIQQELRSIQHDYKNMLSGLYAQASEGNAEAVKEYIDTKLLKIDETVRENLRQMSQLTQIELPELKGLILTKMLEAERDKVSLQLEVMFPVSRVSMAIEDLLRCMGILLDNAIEEARTHKESVVTLILLQEEKTLTVVVKNPVRDKPELALIQNEGYSNKSSSRGIGLFNYQNIIKKYPNAAKETKIDGEYFIQVLVLANN